MKGSPATDTRTDGALKPSQPAMKVTDRPGAVVIGGDYRGLGIVRSLGRHGIPVWVLTAEHVLAGTSRYAQRRLPWPETGEAEQLAYLLDLSAHNHLDGWVLFPTGDETAALVARNQEVLSRQFRLTTPSWEMMKWAYDKRLTYRLAAELGVDCPWTYYPADRADVERVECAFPTILKPAVKDRRNPFTYAKAWKAEDRKQLLARYDEACAQIEPEFIMLQEMIPGGGETQFSYAALCKEGRPVASIIARRTRQYPVDFGRLSSFVETIELPEVEEASLKLLAALRYNGLVEVEFKRDPRNGLYKLLDVNPRVWGWHTLGARAGVDFAHLLWKMTLGDPVPERHARPGVRWMRMVMDLPAAAQEIRAGRLSPMAYLRSIWGQVESATFALDDPLPGLIEVPLVLYMAAKRRAA
jgi:D-aspartate ligase